MTQHTRTIAHLSAIEPVEGVEPALMRGHPANSPTPVHAIRLVVRGQPRGKDRPRFNRSTGNVFTTAPTRDFEAKIAQMAHEARKTLDLANAMAWDGPVHVDVVAVVGIARSWPKWRQWAAQRGLWQCTSRPDVDQFIKAALDGISGVLIRDDALVSRVSGHKMHDDGDGARLEVTVRMFNQPTRAQSTQQAEQQQTQRTDDTHKRGITWRHVK